MKSSSKTQFSDRCLPAFEKALINFDRNDLAKYPGAVIGLDFDFNIAYVNQAWDLFAEYNAGQPTIDEKWNLGASYLAAISRIVGPVYEALFEWALLRENWKEIRFRGAGLMGRPIGDGGGSEYNARLVPTDPASFLNITLVPDPAQGDALPDAFAGQSRGDLHHRLQRLAARCHLDDMTDIVGSEGALDFTDVAASGVRKFYVVTPTRTP